MTRRAGGGTRKTVFFLVDLFLILSTFDSFLCVCVVIRLLERLMGLKGVARSEDDIEPPEVRFGVDEAFGRLT